MIIKLSIIATLKFTVRGSSNPSTIYARFTDGRKLHIIAKTDFLINPEFWDEVKATPKQKANNPDKLNLGIELGKLNTKIFQEYEKDKGTGIQFNKEWLPTKVELHLLFEKKDEIGGFVANYYWSSTIYDGWPWIEDFDKYSMTMVSNPNQLHFARAVRSIN